MATIEPTPSVPVNGVSVNIWTSVTENDTASPITLSGSAPALSAVQFTGTFGGATAIMQGSNDGTNWVALNDLTGTAISLTAAGGVEFTTSFVYLRPSFSGGTGQTLTAIMSTRG
jgi:hypothetical protein